jgi:hypothetical protein
MNMLCFESFYDHLCGLVVKATDPEIPGSIPEISEK